MFELETVHLVLPIDTDSHGLRIRLIGTKPEWLGFRSAQLHVQGDVWAALCDQFGSTPVGSQNGPCIRSRCVPLLWMLLRFGSDQTDST